MRLIETDSNTNKDISSAVSIGSYTATAVRGVIVRVLVAQAAGNGDYVIYATLTKSTVEYRVIPITTATAASGVTSLAFVSIAIPVDVDDILQVYIDGLAGDNSTPDTRVDFYEKDYLRPTVSGRTADIAATGEIGLDLTNILQATAPTTLTNITVPTVTTVGAVTGLTPANLDVAVSSRLAPAVAARTLGVDTSGRVEISGTKNTLDALNDITAAAAGTAVWGALAASNNTEDTFGNIINDLTDEDAGGVYQFTANALENAPSTTATVAVSSTTAASVASGDLAIRTHHTFSQAVTSTSTANLSTATKLWMGIKADSGDADSAAIALIEKTSGLVYFMGAAAATAAWGTLTVGGSAGAWTITAKLEEQATGLMTSYIGGVLPAEVKALVSGDTVAVWDGDCAVTRGVVQAYS